MQLVGELTGGVVEPTYLTGLQIDEMLVRYTAAGARSYLTDALGSVIAQTDEDQQPINWYGYSPYGEVAIVGDDEGNPVQYTGRENDQTGLYYYRARYYDSVLKRFISQDPIGLAGGYNFYAYVDGNPVSFIDPLGLAPAWVGPTGATMGATGGALTIVGFKTLNPYVCAVGLGIGAVGLGLTAWDMITTPVEQIKDIRNSEDVKAIERNMNNIDGLIRNNGF